MADHLTFSLGYNSYKAYKYVPYGPVHEGMMNLVEES
jgi:proline dehydrogenase